MPFNLGPGEIIGLFAIGLLIFGPKKLPELGKAMGEAILNFKKSFQKMSETDVSNTSVDETKKNGNETHS
jgi:sec-independent protein translocase protein TatA